MASGKKLNDSKGVFPEWHPSNKKKATTKKVEK